MDVRLKTLINDVILNFAKKPLLFLLLVLACPLYSQKSSDSDIAKEADKLFEQEDYSRAYKLYSQLVSNFPKDPIYNYKLGVCMIYSEPDKKKCLPYLKFAATNDDIKELQDVHFYLGKAFHVNYLFDEAIKNYNEFKLTASSTQIKKLQVDREIKACSNGKHLLSSLTDLEVMSKSELSENDYFRSYKKIGGKLLIKPDDFKTKTDKKKNETSVVFLPNGSSVVYYSSYGDNDANGKDLYTASKQADGTYGKPQKVKGVNTEFDEDYPFLHPDGKTLYFASKGFNSMGGYDIFKSIFNEETNTWGAPINLEFPINSPDDDYLFVTDSLETMAYFSTGRQSLPGKIDVLKVKTKRRPIDIIAMKGEVIPGDPEYSLTSNITVKDLFTQKEIAKYTAKEDGSYRMELPNGGKLLFTVETPGLETQSSQVSIPMASAAKPYRQTISYEKGKLKILNYFDELETDDSYLQYLNVIEKKAKLDVSEASNETTPLAVNTTNPEATKEDPKQEKVSDSIINDPEKSITADPKKGMDNKQLAKIAKQDASELKQEALQLNRDYEAANATGLKQKEAADKSLTEANATLSNAELISDESERKIALNAANSKIQTAENDLTIANKILSLASSLKEDANRKEKESKLNMDYANELEKSTNNKGNKASLAKLEELQNEIDALASKTNASENLITEIKTTIEQKEKQITDVEQSNTIAKNDLEEIKTAITDKETELSKTKKKALKKEVTSQIEELKLDEAEKIKQIASNDAEILNLKEELSASKLELDAATKIKTENIAATNNTNSQPISTKSLKEKYKDKTVVLNPQSKSSIEESTTQLYGYNKELDELISKTKIEITKTKNKDAKIKLNSELKQAEQLKKQNQEQITRNTKKLEDINTVAVKTAEVKNTFDPIIAENSDEAVSKLDNLSKQLIGNDNQNFDYNGYQNEEAQNLKVEADTKINDAIAKEKILKERISTSKNELQGNIKIDAKKLNSEAEDLVAQSQKIRNEAKEKVGSEKDKLIEQAKELEEQANTKLISASEVTRKDNEAIIEANRENIQNLINEKKSPEEDLNFVKELREEVKDAFRKAADIRTEGNSLSNIGGKVGSISNAEEKEAEGILKQKQIIEYLKKANPDFVLKEPVTSSSPNASGNSGNEVDVNAALQSINSELSDLAAIKIESYQKLNQANDIEIAQLLSDINEKQTIIDNNPNLKTDLISGNNKVESAKTFKQNSENTTNPNEKLNALIVATKKQNEAIKQFIGIKNSITELGENGVTSNHVKSNPTQNKAPKTATSDLGMLSEIDTEVGGNNPPQNKKPKAANSDLGMLSEIDMGVGTNSGANVETTYDESSLKSDTTTGQILTYFDNNNLYMRNSQAGASAKNSLSLLKDYETKNSEITQKLNTLSNTPESEQKGLSSGELRTKSENLLAEAEDLNAEATQIKKEAEGKKGDEKKQLLEQAKELEGQSQDKMIEGSDYKMKSNDLEYKMNLNAITELIEKLKNDNPEMASEMESRREEYTPLKTQVSNLRIEANALSNKAAKLGAISNAEEKELELIQKQSSLLNSLKQQYPDYVVKETTSLTPEQQATELRQKKSELSEKQYTELTNLINAFSLEYESSKNNVQSNLSPNQETLKQEADELNTESKRLLIQSSQERNETEKMKLLTLAAKSGNAAVEKLNKLLPKSVRPKSDLDALAEIGSGIDNSNEGEYVTVSASKTTKSKNIKNQSKIVGVEVQSGNAYSTSNPIPIDGRMEDGLVFRVQIGAFKTQLPNNAFKGLSPLNGETTNSGYIRYTAGNFFKIENANAVKNDLRNLGYSDAFVVVYFNGRRITLAEAMAEMERQGKTVDPNAPQTAGITANANVPKAAVNPVIQESVSITKELEQMDGLLYTIQIGVYTKQVSKPQILSLKPIFREQLTNGLYRYTAGIYNNPEKLLLDKARVVDMGIRDAFVSAYLNGKRIPFAEAKDLQASGNPLKLEKENPIVFPNRTVEPSSTFDALFNTSVNTVEPFKNQVSEYPIPTAENGVKTTEEGVCYKVQIGAFSKQVPEDVASKFSSIRTWPVDNKQINGLFIYNIGNFSDLAPAKNLKEEAVRLGITDAFITVYRNGKKMYGAEAESYLR
ncbi:hypothetical protein [Aurantibacillus circumpalustris]|uniref:hypothetical protein n=1 Tax=Aurantibacillus circumpalustris TaxID=3036359 RepID=UPI00295C3420|nr:hypothetical protein [Aurantibacillus circumpalustris]